MIDKITYYINLIFLKIFGYSIFVHVKLKNFFKKNIDFYIGQKKCNQKLKKLWVNIK